MPEVAFYMVGDIEDVVAKANRLADESSQMLLTYNDKLNWSLR